MKNKKQKQTLICAGIVAGALAFIGLCGYIATRNKDPMYNFAYAACTDGLKNSKLPVDCKCFAKCSVKSGLTPLDFLEGTPAAVCVFACLNVK